jgi:hypothetical protein
LTASAWGDDLGGTPPSTGNRYTVKQVTINMPQPGKLLVLDAGVESAKFNNPTVTTVHYLAGVYVDGVGVPGTAYPFQTMVPPNSTVDAVPFDLGPGSISNISAGTHTVTLAFVSSDAAANYLVSQSGRLLVVATG